MLYIDVAIGAPFGKGSGTVYIYHGSVADTISLTPQQVGMWYVHIYVCVCNVCNTFR